MAEITKQALKVENNTEFPNNNNGQIKPTNLRGFNEDMIDSTVNQTGYNVDSGSWNSSISALNAFTASAGGLATGSLLTTASFDNGTRNLTFTKGDASTFNVNIPDASGSILPAGTISGSSQVDYPFISNIPAGIISSSQQLPSGLVSSSSQLTASYDLRYALSGSTANINTGSFATTGSNLFTGNQTITGSTDRTGLTFNSGSKGFFVGLNGENACTAVSPTTVIANALEELSTMRLDWQVSS
jgi:hypothetical protein